MKTLIFSISAGIFLLIATLQPPSSSLTEVQQGGTIEGTVTLSKKSTVVRPRMTGRYGMSAGHQRRVEEGDSSPVLIWIDGDKPATANIRKNTKVLNQKGQEFDPKLMAIRQNGAVQIRNSDPVYHNVFSLSSTKKFDVGRRPEGELMEVTFDQPGVVDVFCDIHSNMHAVIYVLPNTALDWAIVDEDTPFELSEVPPGTYTLNIYATGFDEQQMEVQVEEGKTLELGSITLTQ